LEHIDDLTGAFGAKESAGILFLVSDPSPFQHRDKIARGKP
jgi:hypothetical protein